ncbi:hypothetical protein [Streptomyces sp. NPDC058953]|uniref:hypothetical protein n=1 Tax=unclassified Streptomyces TaxID=2593676 RepID=UPI0036CA8368
MYASKFLTRSGAHSRATALALVSVACGVLGFFLLSLLLGPLAILTGYLALRQRGTHAVAPAKAGIVLGASVLIIYAILLAART